MNKWSIETFPEMIIFKNCFVCQRIRLYGDAIILIIHSE